MFAPISRTLALLMVALPLVAASLNAAQAASPSNQEFLFLNEKNLHWDKSPNGYEVSVGKLLVLKSDGLAALIACSFYRDRPGEKLSYGDVGGFKLESGHWSKIDANPCIITLYLRLIDADKLAKSEYTKPQSTDTTRKFAQLKSGSLENTRAIKDDEGDELSRIDALKNQKELDLLLDKVLH